MSPSSNSPRLQQRQQQRQQLDTASNFESPEAEKGSGASTSTVATTTSTVPLSPVSMPDDPESSIQMLRDALEEAQQRDATAKAALAKSDAVILELRSSVRQLKRQMETLQSDKLESESQAQQLSKELNDLQRSAESTLQREQEIHKSRVQRLESELLVTNSQAKEQVVGELQVQLDRAHAQILTADMVRKELEDTLEAEQYTWELRVQDQERQLAQLQQECNTLRQDLEQCRSQWKEAEIGWTKEVADLQRDLDAAHQELLVARSTRGASVNVQEKMKTLESERKELQSCLDEAMHELEAVDAELRRDPHVVEPLQHLFRWLLERNDIEENKPIPKETTKLLEGIQDMIESSIPASPKSPGNDSLRVAELEAQISVFRGDLKAREESATELRASLKEAVALLKPLQDAVAKTDREKKELEAELELLKSQPSNERTEEILKLKREIKSLQEQLVGRSPRRPMKQSSNEEGHEQEKETARAKRNAELALKKMLNDAQARFKQLHQTNHDIVQENKELHSRLEEAEKELVHQHGDEEVVQRDIASEMREAAIAQMEVELKAYKEESDRKEKQLVELQEELERSKHSAPALAVDYRKMEVEVVDLRAQASEKDRLESELNAKEMQLQMKIESERLLNDSLVDALNLLKPLQNHLQTAEQEKRTLVKQLKSYKKRLARMENPNYSFASSKSPSADETLEWETTVRELEQVNARLKPQRDKLKTDLVEMQSRYEVTQEKLVSAEVENHVLVDALKEKEDSEKQMLEELKMMKTKLETSQRELENAKYIATSALVKVEELTMTNVRSNQGSSPIAASFSGSDVMQSSEMQQLRARVESLEYDVASSSIDHNDF